MPPNIPIAHCNRDTIHVPGSAAFCNHIGSWAEPRFLGYPNDFEPVSARAQ
jgi:hypothetical protein